MAGSCLQAGRCAGRRIAALVSRGTGPCNHVAGLQLPVPAGCGAATLTRPGQDQVTEQCHHVAGLQFPLPAGCEAPTLTRPGQY